MPYVDPMPGKEKKAAPKAATKAGAPVKKAPIETSKFASRPRDFGIGRDVPYARDISRFMRWPHFVTQQRKKRVLQRRLKTPPALAQFRKVLDRTTRTSVFKLLKKYAPETRKERRDRLKAAAESKGKDSKKTVATKAPLAVVTGIQEVTRAVEKKQAKLVIIASDVDPIELVLWMPALCRANKVPYAIVKDKARLGDVIGQKTATCVAVKAVKSEDESALKAVIKSVNARFIARTKELSRQWGGLKLSLRSRAKARKARAQTTVASSDDKK
jgi:large subunit ribosomal protein L7Ae